MSNEHYIIEFSYYLQYGEDDDAECCTDGAIVADFDLSKMNDFIDKSISRILDVNKHYNPIVTNFTILRVKKTVVTTVDTLIYSV